MAANKRDSAIEAVRAYHARSSHLPGKPAPAPRRLDRGARPAPFGRYAGAPLIELPPPGGEAEPSFAALHRPGGVAAQGLEAESLSRFLALALGLTAWKELPGARQAFRANPSSGNLHPTEGYLLLPPVAGIGERAALYHYAPDDHALETRCVLPSGVAGEGDGFLVGLASIHWRETWKYGVRAYRYCQLDAGHALASLGYAAAVLGWRLRMLAEPSDGELAELLGLGREDRARGGEQTFPVLLARVETEAGENAPPWEIETLLPALAHGEWLGNPNRLGTGCKTWPAMAAVETAAVKPRTEAPPPAETGPPPDPRPRPAQRLSAPRLIRARRSAVALDGRIFMPRAAFLDLMGRALPGAGVPWEGFPFPPAISLLVCVHRVQGMARGLYLLARDPGHAVRMRDAFGDGLIWEPAEDGLPLYLLRQGDFRRPACNVSLGQDLAGDGVFTVIMMAEFRAVLERDGPWAYRRLHWEAGLVGQVLYLEAEAAGLRACGIGAYYDEATHGLVGLTEGDDRWRDLYHLAVGGRVEETGARAPSASR